MNAQYAVFLLFRFIVITFLSFGLLSQAACTSYGEGWLDSREDDLSKIYVNPFEISVNVELPDALKDAQQALTRAIEQQLLEENRLQTGYGIHSLTLKGMILSYQNGVLEVQGELYDDDEFLVYSRVKRHIESSDDWVQGLDLVVEQMLDELMRKMSEAPQQEYVPYYAVTPVYFVVGGQYYYGNDYYRSYFYEPYYSDWGWWRHHPRHYHDHDNDHDEHHQPPPAPNDKPKPKPHWVSDSIIEALPRSTHISEERVRRRKDERRQYQPSNSSDYGGYWQGGGNHQSNDYNPPSSTGYEPRSVAPPPSVEIYRGSQSPSRPSTPSHMAPRSQNTEHRDYPSPAPRAAPVAAPRSTPAPPPVSMPRPAPPPRMEAPTPASRPTSSGSGGVGHSAPGSGSHKHKRD